MALTEDLPDGAPVPIEYKTCPRYWISQPEVDRILADVEDYERGALGPIGALPAHMVSYYRVATAARRSWMDRMQAEGK